MKGFIRKTEEFFENSGNVKDVKLLLGFLMAIFGAYYLVANRDIHAFVAIESVAGGLLGISALADQGKTGGPKPPAGTNE